MKNRGRAWIAFLLTFAVLSLASVGLLADQNLGGAADRDPLTIDACKTVEPAAVLAFNGDAWNVTSVSPSAGYENSTCHRYVMDIRVGQFSPAVAGGHSAANTFRLYSMLHGLYLESTSGGPSQQNCPTARLHVRYYRRGPRGNDFATIGGGTMTGHWMPAPHAHCELQPEGSFQDPGDLTPPSRGTTTYRFALRGAYQGQAHRVYGRALRPMLP